MKKFIPPLFFLLGILACFLLALKTGFHPILEAFARVGFLGFFALLAFQLAKNFLLGAAWKAGAVDFPYLRLTFARLVRDGAATCLPFSQLGGMALGIRATLGSKDTDGSPGESRKTWPEAIAVNLMDITTEVLAEIAFILLGILCLLTYNHKASLIWPLLLGVSALIAGAVGFVWTQKRSGGALQKAACFLSRHIGKDWSAGLQEGSAQFQENLTRVWSSPRRIAQSSFLHLLAWLAGAALTWSILFFLGHPVEALAAITLEGIVCGLMSAGFFIPGNLGVQEGAYLGIGALVGIPPEFALSLSLLRRGLEMGLGIPALTLWQLSEVRELRKKQRNLPSR